MEDNKVIDINPEQMSSASEPEYDIEKIAKDNPELTESLNKLKADEEIIQPYVDDILKMLRDKLEDKDSNFQLSHGFMTLSKCITYLATAVCKDYNHFQEEVKCAHKLVVENIMPAIPTNDKDNFTMRRLFLASSCMIDYLHWREILGDYVNPASKEEQANTPQE